MSNKGPRGEDPNTVNKHVNYDYDGTPLPDSINGILLPPHVNLDNPATFPEGLTTLDVLAWRQSVSKLVAEPHHEPDGQPVAPTNVPVDSNGVPWSPPKLVVPSCEFRDTTPEVQTASGHYEPVYDELTHICTNGVCLGAIEVPGGIVDLTFRPTPSLGSCSTEDT